MREQLEEAMKDPKVQAQTQELSQMMQSPEMLQKLAQLRVNLPLLQLTLLADFPLPDSALKILIRRLAVFHWAQGIPKWEFYSFIYF
jgi:hypothetical protein